MGKITGAGCGKSGLTLKIVTMHLSFEIMFEYEGQEITAIATPTQTDDIAVYDVRYQDKIISIEPQSTQSDHIIWGQYLTGETNDLIQAIGEAIERAEI